MNQWIRVSTLALLLASVGIAQAATPVVTGKEYKVLLKPELFSSQPKVTSNSFLTDLKAALVSAGFDRTIASSFSKDKTRTVRFYDSPGTCRLRDLSYSFRERVTSGDREATLKFRSTTSSTAANTVITSSSSSAESKFELDVTATNNIYSKSTKQPLSNSKNLNILDDVKDLYPSTSSLNLPSQEAFNIVSNLTVNEVTYAGPTSDLGQQSAEFTVSLWFANANDTTPAIVEASFKVEEANGDFTNKVTERSTLMFNTMKQMSSWVAANAMTKTNWVYQYQPTFCTTAGTGPDSVTSGSTAMPF